MGNAFLDFLIFIFYLISIHSCKKKKTKTKNRALRFPSFSFYHFDILLKLNITNDQTFGDLIRNVHESSILHIKCVGLRWKFFSVLSDFFSVRTMICSDVEKPFECSKTCSWIQEKLDQGEAFDDSKRHPGIGANHNLL